MRIAIDVSCMNPQPMTGVGYYTQSLLRSFVRTQPDFGLRLFASGARQPSPPLSALGRECGSLAFMRLPTRLKTWLWTTIAWPRMDKRTGAVDLAHGAFHLLPAARGIPRVVTVFDLTAIRVAETHTGSSRRTHARYLRHAAGRADAIIAISESCREDVVELLKVDESRVHVVHGGVCLEDYQGPLDEEALAAARRKFGIAGEYFIHLGTIEPRKNLARLVEAYARLREMRKDVPQLVLAGKRGWMCGAVFETIERLGLRQAVIETGYLTQEEAVSLLRGALACTYPSLYEGFGLPVLEAMAAGVPVLTSNVSSLPGVAGDAAVYVEPESVTSIAGGLEALLDGPGAREARVAVGLERARRFTWEQSAAALARVYRGFQ